MQPVILVIHLVVALAIIAVVLIQRSEGGGLGIGGGGIGNLMSPRGTANFLTRLTAILAAIFMTTSLTLAILSGSNKKVEKSILDIPATLPAATATQYSSPPAASETAPVQLPEKTDKNSSNDSLPKPPVSE